MTQPIPQPPSLPILGNLLDLRDPEAPLYALENLAETYGPIYKLSKGKANIIAVSSTAMVEELMDETRFVKAPPLALGKEKEKPGEGNTGNSSGRPAGLFTATNEDPDWAQAHRILVPAFGPLAIEGMFNQMKDIATQLLLKWARRGPDARIVVTDDFTRLTLDTIGLCTMDFRFNSFYSDNMHPFIEAMVGFLTENSNRTKRLPIVTSLMKRKAKQLKSNQDFMFHTGTELVTERRADPCASNKSDLLSSIVNGKDQKTSLGMRDELIVANIITFLIAGHETTSGLLSFAFLQLLKNPIAYQAAQNEVDAVLGRDTISLSHLSKLLYLNGVLRETIRLTPPVPAIQKELAPGCSGSKATLGNGRYQIEPDDKIAILIGVMKREASVYGEDAKEFKPERMMDGNFEKLPSAAGKPFGNGARGLMALLLQNFDFQLHDPAYKLRIKQTLTIKPKDLIMRAHLRHGMGAMELEQFLRGTGSAVTKLPVGSSPLVNSQESSSENQKIILILYGSNTGTCAEFARRLAVIAAEHDFEAQVKELDAVVTTQLPKGMPVVIIISSYEGNPPDNAARFVGWISILGQDSLSGIEYAVFGCGHHDWPTTYQRIPTLIDSTLDSCSAKRLAPRGATGSGKGNMSGDYEDWLTGLLWPALGSSTSNKSAPPTSELGIEMSNMAGVSNFRVDVQEGKVLDTGLLTDPSEPPKRHLEIQLPEDTTYECGDYLAVLPLNSEEHVGNIMSRFALRDDAIVIIKGQEIGMLPLDTPLSVKDLLASHLELFEVASKRIIQACAHFSSDPNLRAHLEYITSTPAIFESQVLTPHLTVISLLNQHPSINLLFPVFISSLSPLRLRYYSISSSPLANPGTCTITYSIHTIMAPNSQEQYHGVCGSYLSSLTPGMSIRCSIRPSSKALFRLPHNHSETPLLMFCAGTGLAPFRGFIQQRAILHSANPHRALAPIGSGS
ncbi:NADPH--cytochrome P450 reductase-like protein [Tricladium varicosporioides]|nr:NADPH--cytochrome P450 reductase-like protein [Hymenoscyphus varicosporioides]